MSLCDKEERNLQIGRVQVEKQESVWKRKTSLKNTTRLSFANMPRSDIRFVKWHIVHRLSFSRETTWIRSLPSLLFL